MNQAYINAYLHITPNIYGKNVKPLSIGHSLILDFIASPFFTGSQVTESDLLSAVFFCSLNFEQGIHFLTNRDKLLENVSKWSETIKKTKPSYQYANELANFKTYLDYYMKFPRRWESENKDPKTPWQFSIIYVLLDKLSESEVLNMPLTKAMCFVACHNSMMGESNLVGVEQSELLDRWEKEELLEKGLVENV